MEKQVQRLQSLDVVRGIAVILMIITHIWISFFWDNSNIIGTILSYIGGYLSFSIFLIVSGFGFGIGQHKLTFKKTIKRSVELLVIYAALGLVYTVLQKQDVNKLFTAPIYLEEYLLTLALFPIVAFGLVRIIQRVKFVRNLLLHSIGAFFVLLLGLTLVYLGRFTAGQNTNYWLSLFIGSAGFHTFPLISYFVIYGIGIWLGWSYRLETKKNYGTEAVAIILVSTIVGFIALPLEKITFSLQSLDAIRWPPTLFFISSSLSVAASMLYGATLLEGIWSNPIGRFFQLAGKYALTLFVVHLLAIYFIQGVVLAKVSQVQTPTPLPTPASRIVTLSTTLDGYKDTKEKWPFSGYKVAIVNIPEITSKTQYYIEIRPQDIGALGALQDFTVSAITKDGAITKLSKNFVTIKDNFVVLTFDAEPSYRAFAFSVSNDIALPSFATVMDVIVKNKKSYGTKLLTLDKTYTSWIYQPYNMSGKRWFVHTPETKTISTEFSAYLPISCDDLQYYLTQAGGVLTIKQEDVEIPYTGTCADIENTSIDSVDYLSAKSIILIPYTVDFAKAKTGKSSILYTLSLPNILGETDYNFDFTKVVAISEPMYVAWTYDWDATMSNINTNAIEALRKEIPFVPVTHFFNPRIWNYFSKTVSDNHINYVKNSVKTYKDEIQLHLHMFSDMVLKAGVKLSTSPGWGNFPTTNSGYDVPLSEYSYEDTKKLLIWSFAEFKKKGLPMPTGIRAGGWMMGMQNLKAAKDVGLKFDSSARTTFNTNNFNSRGHHYKGPWSLQITTQPYWISASNQNNGAIKEKSLGLYEIPNNGGDSWAYKNIDLLSNFQRNFISSELEDAKIVTYITHPDFFVSNQEPEGAKIAPVLKTIGTLLASNDDGPVVFTTLHEYYLNYSGK